MPLVGIGGNAIQDNVYRHIAKSTDLECFFCSLRFTIAPAICHIGTLEIRRESPIDYETCSQLETHLFVDGNSEACSR